METESIAAREGTGKEKHGQSQAGNYWLAMAIISILASSLFLISWRQHFYLVILIAAGLGEVARILADVLGGWNKVTAITLFCFEAVGLMLVGLYRIEGALVELVLLVTVWIIGRLGKDGTNSAQLAEDPQNAAVAEVAPPKPLIPRQVAVTQGPRERTVAEYATPKPLVSRKVTVTAGLFLVLFFSKRKLYQGIKRLSGERD